jgi:NAD(P)-dependent dehydrogenase (short-subunit alcohol dehydrogenase family)
MPSLKGKICVITGGAGSIGLATTRLFLAEGARVMIVDREAEHLARAVGELGHPEVAQAVADVTRAKEVEAAIRATESRFGKIDVLISNAGNFGEVSPIASYPEEVFDSVLATHVKGAFLLAKYATPRMNDGGSIIITSSVAAVRGDPGVYAYITAKSAQIGLMRCLAKELAARRIRVNTIHPGPIDNAFQLAVEKGLGEAIGGDGTAFLNAMIPLGRHGTPEEVAQSMLYLASDQSSFTTGSTLMVTGGMS